MPWSLLFNRYVIGTAILIAVLGGVWWHGERHGDEAGFAREQKVYNAHLAADAAAQKVAELAAATAQLNMALNTQAASAAYEKGKADAESNGQQIVADLRAGNVSLQHRWAGCESSRVSNAAAAAAELDAAERDRQESAGRIIAAADACDAQVAGLQQFVIGERTATAQVKP